MEDILNPKLPGSSNRGLEDQIRRLKKEYLAHYHTGTFEQFFQQDEGTYSTTVQSYVVKADPYITQTEEVTAFKVVFRAKMTAGNGHIKLEYGGESVEVAIDCVATEWFSLTLPVVSARAYGKLELALKVGRPFNTLTVYTPCFYVVRTS